MQSFKGMSFKNEKPSFPGSRVNRCSAAMKQQSAAYMANVVKFVDPEPVLPIVKDYFVR